MKIKLTKVEYEVQDAIKEIMDEEMLTQFQLAVRLKMKDQGNLSKTLKRDMKVSTLIKVINALGGKLKIEHKGREYVLK